LIYLTGCDIILLIMSCDIEPSLQELETSVSGATEDIHEPRLSMQEYLAWAALIPDSPVVVEFIENHQPLSFTVARK
jgi:hypothetical protein